MERLTIGITHWPHTYPRVVALEQCLRSLYRHLSGLYRAQIVVSVIPGESIKSTKKLLRRYPEIRVAWHEGHLEGGDHIQALRDMTSRPYLMYVQDDWWLRRPFDPGPIVSWLTAHQDVCLVRFRWGNADKAVRILTPWPDCELLDELDHRTAFLYSDSPHIQTRALQTIAGRYPPNNFDQCYPLIHDPRWEGRYNQIVKKLSLAKKLRVAMLIDDGKQWWGHIGSPSGTRATFILPDGDPSDDTSGSPVKYTMPKEVNK